MYAGILFGGIGIQVGTHQFQMVQYLIGIAAHSGFKQQVLDEVRQAVFTVRLVACAGIYHKAAMRYGRCYGLVQQADAVL